MTLPSKSTGLLLLQPLFLHPQADSLSLLSTPGASVHSPVQALVMGVLTDFSLPLELKYSTKSSLSDGHCSPLRDVSLFPRLLANTAS